MTQYEIIVFTENSKLLDSLKEDARTALDAILSGRKDPVLRLSDATLEALTDGYLAQVKPLYINAFIEKLFHEVSRTHPLAVLDLNQLTWEMMEQADGVLTEKLSPDPVARFREEFPIIPEYEARIRENFIAAQTEMLDQITAARGEISRRFFGGKKITAIEGLTGMQGDVHRRGRSVAGVKTDAGKFYYKPHDCSLDVLYSELIRQFFSDCTVAAECVPGDGCGFVTELVRRPLKTKDQLHGYYRNFGMLTALFSCIGTSDMHHENLIPCGDRPAAVDLETLFRPVSITPQKEDSAGQLPPSLNDEFAVCALTTAILPHFSPALGCICPLYASPGKSDHLPFIGKRNYSADGYEEDFIEGFQQGYMRVLENREAILALFMSCEKAPVRYILRNTAYYCMVLMQVYRGRYLVSREKQEEVLRRLRIPYEHAHAAVNEEIVGYEAACLKEGDIPYYCFAFNGRDLCGYSTDDVIIRDFLSRSIRDRISDQLALLSEKNMRFETDLVRSVMLHAPADDLLYVRETPIASRAVPESAILPELLEISREIGDSAIHSSYGNVIWYSQADKMFPPDSGTLYTAAAGILLYTAALQRSGLSPDPVPAQESVNFLRAFVDTMEIVSPASVRKNWSMGIQGTAQILSALDRAVLTGLQDTAELFNRLLSALCDKEVHLQENPEKLPELAELLLAVCRSSTAHPRKEELIGKCTEALSSFTPGKKTAVTQTAAVAAALAAAGRIAGKRKAVVASGKLLEQVRAAYREDLRGWPDEKGKFRWTAPRGLQAPWIGLCALEAKKAGIRGAGEVVRLSLLSVMSEDSLRPNDSLCHGNALSVRFLTEAAKQGMGKKYARRAGRILAAMIRRKKEKGAFVVFPRKVRSAFDVSFVRGTTGIGAAALAWLRWSRDGEAPAARPERR